MQPHDHEQKLTETPTPRFQIEKLEERIAPAKGEFPGSPGYHDPPGQNCGWGGHKVRGQCQI